MIFFAKAAALIGHLKLPLWAWLLVALVMFYEGVPVLKNIPGIERAPAGFMLKGRVALATDSAARDANIEWRAALAKAQPDNGYHAFPALTHVPCMGELPSVYDFAAVESISTTGQGVA